MHIYKIYNTGQGKQLPFSGIHMSEEKKELLREYMRELAIKGVETQKKKLGKRGFRKKMSDMGKKSGEVRRANREKMRQEDLDMAGELVKVILR